MRNLYVAAVMACLLLTQSAISQDKAPDTPKGPAAKGPDKPKTPDPATTEVNGKTLDGWIKELHVKDPSRRQAAMMNIMVFPPDRAYIAVSHIIEMLKKHSNQTPLDTGLRTTGCITIGVVLGGAKNPDKLLMRDGMNILRRYLQDPQVNVKYRAAQALGRLGPEAKDSILELVAALKDSSAWEVRQAAAISLGQVALDEKKGPSFGTLQALYGALSDSAQQVRIGAIQSLTFLGVPHDDKIASSLIQALQPVAFKDPEPIVQIWAHMAIMSIFKKFPKENLDYIAKMLKHDEIGVRCQAALALGTVGRDAKSTIPQLLEALSDKEPSVVGWSVWALGRMERSAGGALPRLERIAADTRSSPELQRAAAEAIDLITGKKKLDPDP